MRRTAYATRSPSAEMAASLTKAIAARSSAVSGGRGDMAAYRPIHGGHALRMRIRLDRRARTGLLVGALAMFFALDLAFLVSLRGFAFAPDALGQAVIEIMPGFIVVPLIGLLQFWAKRLLVAGVLVGFGACGAVAGALATDPRRRDRTVLAVGALPWLGSVVLGQLFAPGVVDLSSVLLTSAVGAVTYFTALQLLGGVASYQPDGSAGERSPSRRRVLYGAAAVSALVAVGSLGAGAAVRGLAKRAEGIPQVARRLRSKVSPPPALATYDVKLTSVDGYTDSIRIEKAMEPDTIVAYLMNGVTIPQDHGYPARLLVPNIYGMKNVKWLKSIECVTFDYLGYWMERGWSDIAVINTNTRIDTPVRAVKWDGASKIPIAGIAFAGARGIAKVEVSMDGGATFAAAELEPALGPLTWVRWKLDWT